MKTSPQRIGATLAFVPLCAGFLILFGWQYGIPILRGEAFGTFVAPNTALCFVLCGASVLLQVSRRRFLRQLGVLLGAAVLAFALTVVTEYVLKTDFGIDRILFADRLLSIWKLPLPGRFSINAGVGLTLAGISLTVLRAHRRISELAAALVILDSYLSLLGYLYSVSLLYDRVMALHTAVVLGFLGFSLLFAASGPAVTQVLISPYPGGILSRRIIAAIALLMPCFGLLSLWGQRLKYVSVEFGVALFVLVAVTVFTVLTLRAARVVNDLDGKRRETESALVRSEKLAAAGRMAASVAHEINNPLEAVGNLLYLLRDNTLSVELREQYLKTAEEELSRVAVITKRTLGFYKETSRPVELAASALLESTLEVYRTRIARKRVTVQRSYSEDAWLLLPEGEIRQILANLISNAVDALADEGTLELEASVRGELVMIRIRDDGHGIPEADIARIFEPFFSTKKEVGTGLGLWITKELVTKNKGIIAVESFTAPNHHGTTFTLTFPLARPARPSGSEAAKETFRAAASAE